MDNKISTIKERVLQVSSFKNIKRETFFRDLELSYANFKGNQKKTSLNSDAIDKILSKYPEINPLWLVSGKGAMLKNTRIENQNNLPALNIEQKGVPYYDVDFIGGFDLVVNDNTIMPSFYIDFSPFNDADYWVNVTGKSMSPFISHGDLVALQEYKNWNEFLLFGEIYAIVTDDFRTIKIVGKGDSEGCFSLIPYSKSSEFSKQDIPKQLIKSVFKVKGSIKKFF